MSSSTTLLAMSLSEDMSGDKAKSPSTSPEQPLQSPAIPQYSVTGAPYPPSGAHTWCYTPLRTPRVIRILRLLRLTSCLLHPRIMYGYPPPPAPPKGMHDGPCSPPIPLLRLSDQDLRVWVFPSSSATCGGRGRKAQTDEYSCK